MSQSCDRNLSIWMGDGKGTLLNVMLELLAQLVNTVCEPNICGIFI